MINATGPINQIQTVTTPESHAGKPRRKAVSQSEPQNNCDDEQGENDKEYFRARHVVNSVKDPVRERKQVKSIRRLSVILLND